MVLDENFQEVSDTCEDCWSYIITIAISLAHNSNLNNITLMTNYLNEKKIRSKVTFKMVQNLPKVHHYLHCMCVFHVFQTYKDFHCLF